MVKHYTKDKLLITIPGLMDGGWYKLIHSYTGNKIGQEDNNVFVVVKAHTTDCVVLQRVDKKHFTLRGSEQGKVKYLKVRFRHTTYGNRWGLYHDFSEDCYTEDAELLGPVMDTLLVYDLNCKETFHLSRYNYKVDKIYDDLIKIIEIRRNFNSSKTIIFNSLHKQESGIVLTQKDSLAAADNGIDYFIRHAL